MLRVSVQAGDSSLCCHERSRLLTLRLCGVSDAASPHGNEPADALYLLNLCLLLPPFSPPTSLLLLPDPAAVNSVSLKCAIIIHGTRQASFCFPGCYSCCLFLFLFVYSCGNSPLNASSDIYFLRLSFNPLCRVRLRLTLTRRLRRKHKKKLWVSLGCRRRDAN